MFAGPEVSDHFTLNLYNKVIPSLNSKIWFLFFQNFSFTDIFFRLFTCIRHKKVESDFKFSLNSYGIKSKNLPRIEEHKQIPK